MNVAIILAAGESARMGEPKQLMDFGGKTMLAGVIEAFQTPKVGEIRVVLGYKAKEIADSLKNYRVKFITNKDFKRGMFTSAQTGLSNLPKNCDIFMIALADQPLLKRETVEKLLEEWRIRRAKILVPMCEGRGGHPLLIAGNYAKEIVEMNPDLTLKHFLANHPDDVVRVPVADRGVLTDIDDRESYEQERKKLR
jgi:molybdenum cofactor cytidylyltransferase